MMSMALYKVYTSHLLMRGIFVHFFKRKITQRDIFVIE